MYARCEQPSDWNAKCAICYLASIDSRRVLVHSPAYQIAAEQTDRNLGNGFKSKWTIQSAQTHTAASAIVNETRDACTNASANVYVCENETANRKWMRNSKKMCRFVCGAGNQIEGTMLHKNRKTNPRRDSHRIRCSVSVSQCTGGLRSLHNIVSFMPIAGIVVHLETENWTDEISTDFQSK